MSGCCGNGDPIFHYLTFPTCWKEAITRGDFSNIQEHEAKFIKDILRQYGNFIESSPHHSNPQMTVYKFSY